MKVNIRNFTIRLFRKRRNTAYRYRQLADTSRQLADMLAASVDLPVAFQLIDQKIFGEDGRHGLGWRDLLEDGSDLSRIFQEYRFPSIYINTVKAGEKSGKIAYSLRLLADYYENLSQLQARIRQALIYPMMVLISVCFSLYFMIYFVLPNFERLYHGMGLTVPTSTQRLFQLHEWLTAYQTVLIAGILLLLSGAYLSVRVTMVRQYITEKLLYVPVIRRIPQYIYTYMLVMQMSMLIRGGISIQEAFDDLDSLYGRQIRKQVASIREQMQSGIQLDEVIGSVNCFDDQIHRFIEIGQATGRLDAVFTSAEFYYSENLKNRIQTVIRLLEPSILLAVGSVVLFVILSMLLPVFQLLETM